MRLLESEILVKATDESFSVSLRTMYIDVDPACLDSVCNATIQYKANMN